MIGAKKKMLLAEDDESIVLFERLYFEKVFELCIVDNGLEVYTRYLSFKPDIIVLDLMLPGKEGIDICREIRNADNDIPIVAITALGSSDDKLKGFDSGFTDYIVKPFEPKETVTKLAAITDKANKKKGSRSGQNVHSKIDLSHKYLDSITQFGDISINLERRLVKITERIVRLPRREFDLLVLFVSNAGMVLDRGFLLKSIWKNDITSFPVTSRAVDTCVKRLRQMLSLPTKKVDLKTIKGVGYQLELINDDYSY